MEQAPLSVRYSINRWDLLRGNLTAQLCNRGIIAIHLIFVGWVVFEEIQSGYPMLSHVLAFGVGLLLLNIIGFTIHLLLIDSRGILGEHTITLSPDGLTESTEFNTGLARWNGIGRIVNTKHYLIVIINDFQGHLIPKRAFASVAAANEFEQRMRDSIRGAKMKSTKQP